MTSSLESDIAQLRKSIILQSFLNALRNVLWSILTNANTRSARISTSKVAKVEISNDANNDKIRAKG